MRWRVILLLSLAANFVLAVGWILSARQTSRGGGELQATEISGPAQIKTNVVVRQQFFTWQEVESSDYPTYISNLRAIGCPEQTIRDIIIADVNALFARRHAMEVVTTEQQWWRSDPDTNVLQLAAAKTRELDAERRELLTQLLGPAWETGDLANLPRPSRPGIPLDGPVLGSLPVDVKQAVQDIAMRTQDRLEEYLAAQRAAGQPVDPVQLARLRQQTRSELAGVLSPLQLEEFLLRYSQNANDLRSEFGQLKYFNPTPDEFRAAFRATDPIDQQLQMLAGATNANDLLLRDSLLAQREAALRNALGPERFQQYAALHDPVYRDAVAAAQQAGDPAAAASLYQINLASTQELARIRAATNLTPQQMAYEIKKAELEQIKAAAAALGQELPPEPPPPQPPPPSKVHVLSPGENLNFLARLYGVNPEQLQAANPNLNLQKLKPGDSVTVPINILPPVPALPPNLPQ